MFIPACKGKVKVSNSLVFYAKILNVFFRHKVDVQLY